MVKAYRLVAEKCDYPLHLGVTEAGTEGMGVIKSAAGIGGLLLRGIGATIRISLTDDPVKEVLAAQDILFCCGIGGGINIVSCPTCGRTQSNLIPLVAELEKKTREIKTDRRLTVALMGCVVNGPGEAKHADLGVACGNKSGLLFRKGEIIKKLDESEIVPVLIKEIKELLNA